MKKLISFTLYGEDPKYIRGMFENIKLKEKFYPDWHIIVFHDNSLSEDVLSRLEEKNVILRNVSEYSVLASMWRFLAHDEPDIERFIVRDSDSRITEREAVAVQEWVDSDKALHVMRDHPHHGYAMLGGMWGMKKSDMNMKELCEMYTQADPEQCSDRDNWWMIDQFLLRDVIYRVLGNPNDCMLHAATDYMDKVAWANELWSKDFTIPRNEDKNFIGEIFVFDEEGNEQREYQYKELL